MMTARRSSRAASTAAVTAAMVAASLRLGRIAMAFIRGPPR